jgi:hypothetical protein
MGGTTAQIPNVSLHAAHSRHRSRLCSPTPAPPDQRSRKRTPAASPAARCRPRDAVLNAPERLNGVDACAHESDHTRSWAGWSVPYSTQRRCSTT